MTVDEAIQKHGAMKVFEAGAIGECENFEPLRAMGLEVNAIAEAEQISNAAHDRLTVEEKAANYWEASQDLYKNKEPVNWDAMDDMSISPRKPDESEADYLQRVMIGELMQEQLEKRRASK